MTQERDQLTAKQAELQNTITTLQNTKEENKPVDVQQDPSISNEELERLQQRIAQLEGEQQSLQSQYQAQVSMVCDKCLCAFEHTLLHGYVDVHALILA